MSKITAVVKVNKVPHTDGTQTALLISPAYDNPENAKWAKYTPTLYAQLNVLNEVAKLFEPGKEYLLTFEEKE